MDAQTKRLRAQAKSLEPVIEVGKAGITQGVVDQLKKELRSRKLVKIRMRASSLPQERTKTDRKDAAQDLALRTNSQVIEVVGGVVDLYKR